MIDTVEYKNYIGSVNYSEDDGVFYGEVLGLDNSSISYDGKTVEEMTDCFHTMVDDYLAVCEANSMTPEKSFSDKLTVSVSPELHRLAARFAVNHNITLDAYVESLLSAALAADR